MITIIISGIVLIGLLFILLIGFGILQGRGAADEHYEMLLAKAMQEQQDNLDKLNGVRRM